MTEIRAGQLWVLELANHRNLNLIVGEGEPRGGRPTWDVMVLWGDAVRDRFRIETRCMYVEPEETLEQWILHGRYRLLSAAPRGGEDG